MDTYTIRQAHGEADLQAVVDLWNEAKEWLRERGSDQWQYPVKLDNIRAALAVGTVWLVIHDRERVATVTLNDFADPALWTMEDKPNGALYVHRLVAKRTLPVPGLGVAVLNWCGNMALSAGKDFLRLDAWSTNYRLHDYYLRIGFRLVRTVEAPNIFSGALFERAATIQIPVRITLHGLPRPSER